MYTLKRLAKVNSTNLYAKSDLEKIPDRTVIVADRQTEGRGRFERSWIDLGGDNLFMTIVLKPSEKFSKVYPNLTQYMAVVLSGTLEDYGIKATIKWPNDILIEGKKIAGILSETVMQGTNFKGLVLGLGVNLNSNIEDIKKIKDKEATALNIETANEQIDKEEFIQKLLKNFFKNYEKFLSNGFEIIKQDYLKRAYFIGSEISVQVFNEQKSGLAKSITDLGELVLEKDNKEILLTMGDIL